MRIAAWIERIESYRGELAIDVRGAAGLAAAQEGHRRDAIYVVPLSDTARPSEIIGVPRQVAASRVAVIVAVTNARDPRGAEAATELERVRDMVRAALLGWKGGGAWTPASFRAGRLLHFAGNTIWWQDEYEADVLITQST